MTPVASQINKFEQCRSKDYNDSLVRRSQHHREDNGSQLVLKGMDGPSKSRPVGTKVETTMMPVTTVTSSVTATTLVMCSDHESVVTTSLVTNTTSTMVDTPNVPEGKRKSDV